MKTIGLIGGMSWESTVTYYQIINKVIKDKLGGLHSAKCILYYTIHFSNTRKNRYLKINWCFMWCTSIDELSYLYKL